jgi:hypothetical protein
MNNNWINLRHEGGENDPLAYVVVSVEIDGQRHEAIRELKGNCFDHSVNMDSLPVPLVPVAERDDLRRQLTQHVDWLNERNEQVDGLRQQLTRQRRWSAHLAERLDRTQQACSRLAARERDYCERVVPGVERSRRAAAEQRDSLVRQLRDTLEHFDEALRDLSSDRRDHWQEYVQRARAALDAGKELDPEHCDFCKRDCCGPACSHFWEEPDAGESNDARS